MSTVDQARLYETTDAAVWAEEFSKVEPNIDRGLMIGWFANAMVTAEVHERIRLRRGAVNRVRDLLMAKCWEATDLTEEIVGAVLGDGS